MKRLLMAGMLSIALIGAASLSSIYAAGPQDQGAGAPSDKGAGSTSPGASGDQGAGGMAQGQKLSGVEVTQINKDQGTVHIKNQDGKEETLKLDPSQKAKLDQIQKGDKVDITMVERGGEKVATSISKAG